MHFKVLVFFFQNKMFKESGKKGKSLNNTLEVIHKSESVEFYEVLN